MSTSSGIVGQSLDDNEVPGTSGTTIEVLAPQITVPSGGTNSETRDNYDDHTEEESGKEKEEGSQYDESSGRSTHNEPEQGKSAEVIIGRLSKKSTSIRKKRKSKKNVPMTTVPVKRVQQVEIGGELAQIYPAHSPMFARMADGTILKGID